MDRDGLDRGRQAGLGKGQAIDTNVVVLSEWIEGNFGEGRYWGGEDLSR